MEDFGMEYWSNGQEHEASAAPVTVHELNLFFSVEAESYLPHVAISAAFFCCLAAFGVIVFRYIGLWQDSSVTIDLGNPSNHQTSFQTDHTLPAIYFKWSFVSLKKVPWIYCSWLHCSRFCNFVYMIYQRFEVELRKAASLIFEYFNKGELPTVAT